MWSRCFLDLFVDLGSFVVGLSQIFSFLSYRSNFHTSMMACCCPSCYWHLPRYFFSMFLHLFIDSFPREDAAGGLSREYVLRIPACRKMRLNGAVCRNHRIKRVVPCRCRTGTLNNPTKCLWRIPAHLCRQIFD